MYRQFKYTANLDIILDPLTNELHIYMVLQWVGREDLTPLPRSLESLEAILDLEVSDVERSGYQSQHNVLIFRLDISWY